MIRQSGYQHIQILHWLETQFVMHLEYEVNVWICSGSYGAVVATTRRGKDGRTALATAIPCHNRLCLAILSYIPRGQSTSAAHHVVYWKDGECAEVCMVMALFVRTQGSVNWWWCQWVPRGNYLLPGSHHATALCFGCFWHHRSK
jgi:hypothetical protein